MGGGGERRATKAHRNTLQWRLNTGNTKAPQSSLWSALYLVPPPLGTLSGACPPCREKTEEYTRLIRAKDADGIMALLTDVSVRGGPPIET